MTIGYVLFRHRGKSVTISSNDSGSTDSVKDASMAPSGHTSQPGGSLTHNDSTSSFSSVINTYELGIWMCISKELFLKN